MHKKVLSLEACWLIINKQEIDKIISSIKEVVTTID